MKRLESKMSFYLPSNTSGGSTLSGLRCLVMGISVETCVKLAREVR